MQINNTNTLFFTNLPRWHWANFYILQMNHLFNLVALFFSTFIFSQAVITGTISDGEFNDPLPFANVVLKTADEETTIGGSTSDFDGKYSFDVTQGNYILEFSYVGYGTQKITDVAVNSDGEVIVDITLKPIDNALDEVVVTTTARQNSEVAVLALQKKSINLIDGLSTQSIQKSGDTNLASAIKRVPGVSIQNGKFVIVRGLSDRYSKTLLGGLEVPGLDPDKNTLQLDIFPTNLLENIIVNKSSSAELNADFSGGVVNIILKDFSALPEYTFSISGGYNPSMNLVNNAIQNNPSGLNVFGFNNGYFDRRIGAQQDIPLPEPSQPGRSSVLTKITEVFAPEMAVHRYKSGLNYNLGASASNQFSLSDEKSIGFIAALGFRSTTEYYANYSTGTTNKEPSGITQETSQDGEFGKITKLASGLIGVSFKTEQSKYKLNLLNLRSGESSAINAVFADYLENPYVGVANVLAYTERNMISIPFSAKHILNEGKSVIEWKIAPSFAEVFDKDLKKTVFETNEERSYFILSPATTQLPQRLWRTLREDAIASNVMYTYELTEGVIEGKLKTGVSFASKDRSFRTSEYSIDYIGRSENLSGNPNNLLDPNNLWTPQSNEGSHIVGDFQRTNQYDASSTTHAGFISAELKLSDAWKSVVGIRFENYIVKYSGLDSEFEALDDAELINVKDFYPSLNLIHSLSEETNLRFSYARTTARPSFKENSAAKIYDPITERFFIGNTLLNPSYINNLDLRYEKYGEGNQFFALSTFFKHLNDPIEIVAYDYNTPNQLIARNSQKATVYGIELEYRKNILDNSTKKIAVNINTSFIHSRLNMTDEEYQGRVITEPTREIDPYRSLQGQSPFLINTGVVYSLPEINLESTLSYNVQGKTLEVVGVGNIPDVYTDPFHNLNLTVIKKFGNNQNQRLTLKVQNILNDSRESYYDYFGEQRLPFSLYDLDRTISLGYNIKF